MSQLSRTPAIDELVAAIDANPDDDHNRAVLIDLLADLGAPCAAQFAQARAGQPIARAKRSVAFGPLASFFRSIDLVGGLPAAATIARGVSVDQLSAVIRDARCGLLRRISLSNGSRARYTQLIAAKELVGLHEIDGCDGAILSAALEGGHRLTHLYNVSYYDRSLDEILARSDFDSVRHLEIPVVSTEVSALMMQIIEDLEGIYARAPRNLVLVEPSASLDVARIVVAAFPSFVPHTTVSVHGVTLRREGQAIVADTSSPELAALIREVLPDAMIRS